MIPEINLRVYSEIKSSEMIKIKVNVKDIFLILTARRDNFKIVAMKKNFFNKNKIK